MVYSKIYITKMRLLFTLLLLSVFLISCPILPADFISKNAFWTADIDQPVGVSPLTDMTGNIIILDFYGTLYSYSPEGVQNWVLKLNSPGLISPIVTPDNKICVISGTSSLFYIDAAAGNLIWANREQNEKIEHLPRIIDNGIFIFSPVLNTIFKYNRTTGELVNSAIIPLENNNYGWGGILATNTRLFFINYSDTSIYIYDTGLNLINSYSYIQYIDIIDDDGFEYKERYGSSFNNFITVNNVLYGFGDIALFAFPDIPNEQDYTLRPGFAVLDDNGVVSEQVFSSVYTYEYMVGTSSVDFQIPGILFNSDGDFIGTTYTPAAVITSLDDISESIIDETMQMFLWDSSLFWVNPTKKVVLKHYSEDEYETGAPQGTAYGLIDLLNKSYKNILWLPEYQSDNLLPVAVKDPNESIRLIFISKEGLLAAFETDVIPEDNLKWYTAGSDFHRWGR